MTRRTVIIVLTFISLGAAHQFSSAEGPIDLAPQLSRPDFDQRWAEITAEGDLQLVGTIFKPASRMEARTYTVAVPVVEKTADGKSITRLVCETKIKEVAVSQLEAVTGAWLIRHPTLAVPDEVVWSFRAYELNGTRVAPASLVERLKKPQLVVVTHNFEPLPASFAGLFKPGTLVIALRSEFALSPMPIGENSFVKELPQALRDVPLPPTFQLMKLTDADEVELRTIHSLTERVRQIAPIPATPNDDPAEKSPADAHPLKTRRHRLELTRTVSRTEISGSTVDGGSLTEAHWSVLRQREIPVVIGGGAQTFWLQNIKPKILLIRLPFCD